MLVRQMNRRSITRLLGFFRLESRNFEFAQGMRAALGLSVPMGMGLLLNQVPGAVIVTLATWFVLVTDMGFGKSSSNLDRHACPSSWTQCTQHPVVDAHRKCRAA
jgi:hypothetical protein